MRTTNRLKSFAKATLLGGVMLLPVAALAVEVYDHDGDQKSPKQLNDPLPPSAMPKNTPPGAVPTPRGTPEGMGNETDFSKTPGDDDASDGVDEPGRDPVSGQPRPAPGVQKH